MHNLSKIDPIKRRATCRICGRVKVYKTQGRQGKRQRLYISWRCSKMVMQDAKLSRYGITHNEVERMREKQKNKCAICRRPFKRSPHVDHCHKSKRVRGLLCAPCNMGLGMFQDNTRLLLKAIRYLKRSC